MSILELGSLQLTLFAMMLIGALLKKKDIIDENGKKCLADLCINVVIPCNIFKSCLIELDAGVLKSCAMLLVSAVVMQLLCLALNRFLFDRYDPQRKKVLQYCTIVPVSGFLGNPIAEGIYNEVGVLYTSIFFDPDAHCDVVGRHDVFCRGRDGGKEKGHQKRADAPLPCCHLFGAPLHGDAGAVAIRDPEQREVYRELQLHADAAAVGVCGGIKTSFLFDRFVLR